MAKTAAIRPDEKQCTKCGSVQLISAFYTTGRCVDGRPKYNSWCKSCIKHKMASYHEDTWGPQKLKHSAYKRTRTVRSYLAYLRAKAVRRGGECISTDALEVLWVDQHGMCKLSGWPMTMELAKGVVPTNASIDRISSDAGYVLGNVQLVCRAVNVAKSDLAQSKFLQLCKAITENANGQT